jgi:biotin carboxyl carrier protein
MIYKVKIDNRLFEVEIEDIHARPVIALVDGIEIAVWPEDSRVTNRESKPVSQVSPSSGQLSTRGSATDPGSSVVENGKNLSASREVASREVRAPIPGVIVAICVQPEEEVATGQELCVLEAMKMKNSIRASHAGKIASVKIQVGQHVQHQQTLMEFGD